jgi:hypothetical protein
MWKVDKGSFTGVTSANYTNVLDWKTAELGEKTILLKNTDAGQSLKYKLRGYAVEGGNRGYSFSSYLLLKSVLLYHRFM